MTRQTLLIVDDHTAHLLVATALLDAFGYGYEVAHGGREALEMLPRHDFGLILLDVQMPGLDGYRVASLIRRRETARRTPIIGVTAYASAGELDMCLRVGMDATLAKPLEAARLQALLHAFVRG